MLIVTCKKNVKVENVAESAKILTNIQTCRDCTLHQWNVACEQALRWGLTRDSRSGADCEASRERFGAVSRLASQSARDRESRARPQRRACSQAKNNENRQNYRLSSTRNSVSKLCHADLHYLGLKTPLKTVNFQLFCRVLLFQYSKKFDFPKCCLVSLVDIGNCKVKPSIRIQLFASPIVNLLSLFKIFVSLK